jgi:hypothetical protein
VSYDAAAKVSQDRELIKAHWNKAQHPGYFGDLKDGKHDGTYNDPRVSIIEIIPDEIRYWVSSKNTLLKTAQVALAAVTGNGTAPGELRIITKAEVNTLMMSLRACLLTMCIDPAHSGSAEQGLSSTFDI